MVGDWAAPDNPNYDQLMWESSGEFLNPVYPPASDQPEATSSAFSLPSENGDPSHSSSFSTADSLGQGSPSSVDTAGKSWRCDECDKGFKRNSELQRHLQTTLKHVGRRYFCDRCRNSYTRKETLKKHKCEAK
ncbi:hypothetical protein F5887DRAFT_520547 [Amanita rubescens]|nr:hypothetical protein F5887DRAFT_520547 [Amanita rubescens]